MMYTWHVILRGQRRVCSGGGQYLLEDTYTGTIAKLREGL